ncbi:MAG: permease [Alicyclobacillaceae bacterium]|nr:permease [Alicyclobacillaceae bacterium]
MDRTLLMFGALTVTAYALLSWLRPAKAAHGLDIAVDMFLQALPWIVVSMFMAGLLAQLFQPAFIARLLGRDSGIAGIVLAALMGLCGTGSKWAVYPLAAGLLAVGASPGSVFSFVTTWQLVSLPRLPAEVPFYGPRFTLVRALVSVVIAILGGILVELLETRTGR